MLKANFLPHLLTIYGPSRLLSLPGNRDERTKWLITLGQGEKAKPPPPILLVSSRTPYSPGRGFSATVQSGSEDCVWLDVTEMSMQEVKQARGLFFTGDQKSDEEHGVCHPDRKKGGGEGLLPGRCLFLWE